MATESIVDIDSLLIPISEDAPCGVDLRESGSAEYQQLKDARRSIASLSRARKFDAQSDPQIDENWRLIFRLAPEVIKDQAKDLEVAAWWTEAALRLKGFAGLRDGFRLIRGLVENFWDGLYPLPDEDGLETKVYPVTGLNGEDGRGTLIQPLRSVPLSEDGDAFNFNLYDRVNEASRITDPEAQRQRLEDIGVDMAQIQHQVAVSSVGFYRNLLDDLEESLQTFREMSALFDEKCGFQHSPPSSAIKETLENILEAVKRLTKDKFPPETEPESAAQATDEAPVEAGAMQAPRGGSVSVGAITNREEAINQLLLIADYFRRTEPHSPLCGALERLASWGRMSVQELMLQLIPDETSRAVYSQLTGIPLGEDAMPIGALASMARPVAAAAPVETPAASEAASTTPPVAEENEWGADPDDPRAGW